MTNRILLLEYFTTDNAVLIFGVRADWEKPKIREVHLDLTVIRQFATDNFSLISDAYKAISTGSKVIELDEEEWNDTFDALISPVLDWSESGDYIYLVPHDVLHYLPLHALKLDDRYLIERNPVIYTPSASVLRYCQERRQTRTERMLIMGDSAEDEPLPNAREETLEIANLFGVEPYLGDVVTRSFVLEKITGQYDILHFACHGFFNSIEPLKSGILMADETIEDDIGLTVMGYPHHRILTGEDFLALPQKLDVSLVTLSACDTGVNDIKPGDELFGLMRALISAGTPSILMSLWSVNDISTALLMNKFYEALKAGHQKIIALNHAQKYLMNLTAKQTYELYETRTLHNQSDFARTQNLNRILRRLRTKLKRRVQPDEKLFSHPYYWAPFILVGDWQ